jgi:DNA primase
LAKQWDWEVYAFFRDRLTIPIRDQLGNIIAFGARALQDGQGPKYLNSSGSIIYDKSNTLYGIDHLKAWVKEHKAIIVVEWYFDVIALTMAHIDIWVATCGTALTTNHITTLKRYTDTFYLLFDNDTAGATATLRWLAIAYGQNIYPKIISLQNSIKSTNPSAKIKDIDDLVYDNPQAEDDIKLLLKQSQDWFIWSIGYYHTHYDINSPVDRQKMLYGLFDLIYAVESMSTQNLFLEQMSHTLHMDYTLTVSQYRQYIKNEKKLSWPRLWSKQSQSVESTSERLDKKTLILIALLHNDFWKTLSIDETWISTVHKFIDIIRLSDHIYPIEQILERQLRREHEVEPFGDKSAQVTAFVKKVLVPYLHSLQKTALKTLNDDDKQLLLQLSGKLR